MGCSGESGQRPSTGTSASGALTFTALFYLVVLTASVQQVAACVGDCNNDGRVTVDETIKMANIALGKANVSTCALGGLDNGNQVRIYEVVTAVKNALGHCTVDVNGDWSGTWQSDNGVESGSIDFLQLTQSGSRISGAVNVGGAEECYSQAALSGTVSGTAFTASLTAATNGIRVSVNGTVSGNELSGSYKTTSGPAQCGDQGSFEAMR